MDVSDILAIAAQVRAEQQRQQPICRNKTIYRTVERVEEAVREASERYGEPMFFYRCPVCAQFHLTKQEQ